MSAKTADRGLVVLREVLRLSGDRSKVEHPPKVKNKYAVRFAQHMADMLAMDLAKWMKGIEASTKRTATSDKGRQQLDINFSTPALGLALGISLKSVHTRDYTQGRVGRYTHNVKRNAEELRIEASGYHKRQPYAVMIGMLFLPFDSCSDAKKTVSSFGSWVRSLRPYVGRRDPRDDADRFEKIYIALYEPDGSDLRFFDVESDPPRTGRPPHTGELFAADGRPARSLTYEELLEAIHAQYLSRNRVEFRWADGEEEDLDPEGPLPEDGS
jgi:hypothetical protein